jgi:4-hydroxybenzoate polyprenyltransferase
MSYASNLPDSAKLPAQSVDAGKAVSSSVGRGRLVATRSAGLRTWAKLLRVHQYAKNGLVFVPMLTAQQLNTHALLLEIGAFSAFSLCASCVYIFNDLADIEADRAHPTKRNRPLAAGTIGPPVAIIVAFLSLLVALAIAASVSLPFLGVLLVYLALTTAYTYSLKRKMFVDVVVLAMLYTIRVIGGAVAIGVETSEWLLAFSMFIFTALALVKRYTELSDLLDKAMPGPANRNYAVSDLSIVAALAAASGFNAVTVFALYISSDAVRHLYHRPQLLWLICPILMYWIARILMLSHRGMMDEDPVVFALKDRRSFVCGLAIGAILLAGL